jgi:hypothetical protein
LPSPIVEEVVKDRKRPTCPESLYNARHCRQVECSFQLSGKCRPYNSTESDLALATSGRRCENPLTRFKGHSGFSLSVKSSEYAFHAPSKELPMSKKTNRSLRCHGWRLTDQQRNRQLRWWTHWVGVNNPRSWLGFEKKQ